MNEMVQGVEDATDQDLMVLVARGDQRAYRILVVRHISKAHAIARRYLPRQEDAEEVVQEAFLQVWIHAPGFSAERAGFGTWFYRILANKCLDGLRRRSGCRDVVVDDAVMQNFPDEASPAQDAALAQSEDGQRVRRAVETLPERQRLAVIMSYFGEMTNPQVAAAMGMNLKALEGLLVRARKALRQTLAAGGVCAFDSHGHEQQAGNGGRSRRKV